MNHTKYLCAFFLGFSFTACYVQVPAFPKVITYEKASQVPPERLFNQAAFKRSAEASELRIIRDVGSEFRSESVLVFIDSVKFAEIKVWESTTVFLPSGSRRIELAWPEGILQPKWKETLLLECSPGAIKIVRIELGRPKPQMRLANQ